MKKTFLKVAVLAALIMLGFTACPKPTDDLSTKKSTTQTPKDDAVTGPLTTEATWPGKDEAGNSITYFINETYLIKDGGSLTIEEGAIVKFGESGGIRVNNQTITANGVVFTSWRDPRGRKINSAGTADPAPGDWGQIYIYGGVAKFTNCEFSYGGKKKQYCRNSKRFF